MKRMHVEHSRSVKQCLLRSNLFGLDSILSFDVTFH